VSAGWLRGGIDGALQLGYQFGNGAVQVVSDMANGSPVMRLPRLDPNSLKQHGGGEVVGMGNKWDRHPGTDGLIYRADMPHLPAGPVGEADGAHDRHHEGDPNRQRALPRFAHNSI
jgi:hypothetical protein